MILQSGNERLSMNVSDYTPIEPIGSDRLLEVQLVLPLIVESVKKDELMPY